MRLTPREGSEDEPNFLRALSKLTGSYLVVREHAAHMHLHALYIGDAEMKTIRNSVTNTLGKTGNSVISMKVGKDFGKACRYICKGQSTHPDPKGDPADVVARHGLLFTDAWIAEHHEEYWRQSADVKANKDVPFPIHVEHYMKLNNLEFTVENAAAAAVEMTIAHKKILNDHYLAGVVKMVVAKNNRQYKAEVIRQLVQKCSYDA